MNKDMAETAPDDDGPPAIAPSFLELSAEALDFENLNIDEDLELKAQRALECPCVAELRRGPCGKVFSDALVCFIKSTAEEKGSDCLNVFLEMQACMIENPSAFSEYNDEDEEGKEEDNGKSKQ